MFSTRMVGKTKENHPKRQGLFTPLNLSENPRGKRNIAENTRNALKPSENPGQTEEWYSWFCLCSYLVCRLLKEAKQVEHLKLVVQGAAETMLAEAPALARSSLFPRTGALGGSGLATGMRQMRVVLIRGCFRWPRTVASRGAPSTVRNFMTSSGCSMEGALQKKGNRTNRTGSSTILKLIWGGNLLDFPGLGLGDLPTARNLEIQNVSQIALYALPLRYLVCFVFFVLPRRLCENLYKSLAAKLDSPLSRGSFLLETTLTQSVP